MRYTILTKGDSKSNALKHKMMNYMKDFRMIEDSENPEIVISVGGDGTLLQAFHQYSHMLSKSGICWSSYRSFRILCGLVTS